MPGQRQAVSEEQWYLHVGVVGTMHVFSGGLAAFYSAPFTGLCPPKH